MSATAVVAKPDTKLKEAVSATAAVSKLVSGSGGDAKTLDLRVMTYNILAEVWVKPEWFPNVSADALLKSKRFPLSTDIIILSGCDIVFIQEATKAFRQALLDSKAVDMYNISEISSNHPTSAKEGTNKEAVNGTMVLVRKTLPAKTFAFRIHGNGFIGVTPDESSVQLIGIHLDWADDGTAQLEEVVKLIGTSNAAVFGDWNKNPAEIEALNVMKTSVGKLVSDNGATCYNPTKGGFHLDHCATFGNGAFAIAVNKTNQSYEYRLRSHFFADPIKALEYTLGTVGSDHLPVVFDAKLPRKWV